MNNTMPEIENMFNLLKELDGLKAEARKADQSNAIVNAYLAANPDAAKALLNRAKAWNAHAARRTEAEANVRRCRDCVARIEAGIKACRESIDGWTKQINAAKGEILRLQKALKPNAMALAKAEAELDALS